MDNARSISPSRMEQANKEKDLLISHLKSKLFQLDQGAKNYSDLLAKYRQLENEFQLMSEAKLRLEYELRQKNETTNKILSDLKGQNDSLIAELGDKNAMNKKLYGDNSRLYKSLEGKNCENEQLVGQVQQNENAINGLSLDNEQSLARINQLNGLSFENENNLKQLSLDYDNLNLKNHNLEKDLNCLTNVLSDHQRALDNEKMVNQDLVQKLNDAENSLANLQKQLEMANRTISEIENKYNDVGNVNDSTRNDIEKTKMDLDGERRIRIEAEKNNRDLETMLRAKTDEVARMGTMNDSLKMNVDQMANAKIQLENELKKYKDIIQVLQGQTNRLSEELTIIIDTDDRMLDQLRNLDRLIAVVSENKRILNDTMMQLKQYGI